MTSRGTGGYVARQNWLAWLGLITSIAGALADAGEILPKGMPEVMQVIGAIAAAVSRSILSGSATRKTD